MDVTGEMINGGAGSPDLAVLIAGIADGRRLAAEHRDDGTGHCLSCRFGGDATGRAIWPCSGHRMAQRVITLQDRAADDALSALGLSCP